MRTGAIDGAYRFSEIGTTKFGFMGHLWFGNRESEPARAFVVLTSGGRTPDAGESVWVKRFPA